MDSTTIELMINNIPDVVPQYASLAINQNTAVIVVCSILAIICVILSIWRYRKEVKKKQNDKYYEFFDDGVASIIIITICALIFLMCIILIGMSRFDISWWISDPTSMFIKSITP